MFLLGQPLNLGRQDGEPSKEFGDSRHKQAVEFVKGVAFSFDRGGEPRQRQDIERRTGFEQQFELAENLPPFHQRLDQEVIVESHRHHRHTRIECVLKVVSPFVGLDRIVRGVLDHYGIILGRFFVVVKGLFGLALVELERHQPHD